MIAHVNNVWFEELYFVNPYDLGVIYKIQNFIRIFHDLGDERLFTIGCDLFRTVSGCPPESATEFPIYPDSRGEILTFF